MRYSESAEQVRSREGASLARAAFAEEEVGGLGGLEASKIGVNVSGAVVQCCTLCDPICERVDFQTVMR